MGKRRISREFVLQYLYACDVNNSFDMKNLKMFCELWRELHAVDDEKFNENFIFSESLISKIITNLDHIDSLIKKYTENWTFSRITLIDRNLLRMAICEILYMTDIPPVVSIDEAVDIAKKYSTPDSGKFVNGVLDKVKDELAKHKLS